MKKLIDKMVDRFLCWKLPADFAPDAGISFKAEFNEGTPWPMRHEPTGTNLFHAGQARQMIEHLLGAAFSLPETYKTEEEGDAYTHGYFDGNDEAEEELTRLRAKVAELEAKVPKWQPITAPGQVKEGDILRFNIGDQRFLERAKVILHAGTEQEEIIYRMKKNYYVITSMAIAGTAGQKNVEWLPAAPVAEK